MTSSSSNTTRFRSATEFPKSIDALESQQASVLYEEMRDCLIFTNRSRAQLIRRNVQHKDTTLQLRDRINHFQSLIDQLQNQKQSQLQAKEALIAQLSEEMGQMGAQLDTLSAAFDAVGNIEAETQTSWGSLIFPRRFLNLLQAVKSLMQWWQQQDDDRTHPVELTGNIIDEQDRRDRPQLYSDQASNNRSLLDR